MSSFPSLAERNNYVESLKREYFEAIDRITPDEYKSRPIIDLDQTGSISFTLTKELVEKYELEKWLANYKHEAEHSTGGIRGPQNARYYWDPRFPIHQLGVMLATLGKSLVLKDKITDREIHKLVAGEVRYNTKAYIELISRIHAAQGIITHQVPNNDVTAVWMASFLIFMLDYDGGEFVTSSHAISSKTATKDLDSQGSQFLPEMSLAFIAKIEYILNLAKSIPGGYPITLAPKRNPLTVQDVGGTRLYAEYLRKGVASEANLALIRSAIGKGMRLMYETVGGCMHRTMVPLLQEFRILEAFEWNNAEEDPFFHGVGKTRRVNPQTGAEQFFDLSCDACLFEVVETMAYELFLKDKPIGYVVLITDPDGDRLAVGQVEPAANARLMEDLGVNFVRIDDEKIFSVYHPTYSFLMIMDFNMKQLKKDGRWADHPRFLITTTPSSRIWDEWAQANGIQVVTTPVGFKEIASTMKRVEKKLLGDPTRPVILDDIWREGVNLGVDPRIAFAGEESGGMIIGPEDVIVSRGGRKALAMREKSAGEASIIATALAAHLHLKHQTMAEYLAEIFTECDAKFRYYDRADITYYNESEPDPVQLMKTKTEGELRRDTIDLYYLGLAMALRDGTVTIGDVRSILAEALPGLDFSTLNEVKFTGDATYLAFDNMFVQIRKSGTDAKLRGYSNGNDKEQIKRYLDVLVHYSGDVTPGYNAKIPEEYRRTIYDRTKTIYEAYLYKGL